MGRSIGAGLILLASLFSEVFAASDSPSSYPSTISVHGHHYLLRLQQNDTLSQQLSVPLSARHYRGRLAGHPQSWVRLSNVDGNWQGILSFGGQIYLIDLPADTDSGQGVARSRVMSAEPASSHPPVACGHPGHAHKQSSRAIVNPNVHSALQIPQQVAFSSLCQTTIDDGVGGEVCLLAELEFAFDEQFQNLFGANARAQAESLINMVEGFYRNDFNIIFDTLTLELIEGTLFSTTTLASEDEDGNSGLLEDIQSRKSNGQIPFIQNDRALFHLVTGRSFDGSTAGVAYVDALCNRFGFGVGTSQVLRSFGGNPNMSLTALVVAHEIGHNFGASHDGDGNNCPDSGFIMAPSVSSNASEFSSCSQSTIETAISAINSPELCFNFPVDLVITSAGGNPTSAASGAEVTLEYTVTTEDAFRNLSQISVSGSVPASQGRFNSVELNGQGCTVAADGLSYSCTLDNPPASMTLLTRVVATVDGVEFTQQVAVSGDNEIVDISTANNEQQTALAVTGSAVPPDAASGLSANQGSGTNVSLSWTDNSDNEDNFRVERQVGSGAFTNLATLAANTTSYTDTTSVAGTSYGYRVIAVNSTGDSATSNTATITLVSPIPTAASGLSASQGSGTDVSLTWTDNSDNEDNFRVERRVGSGAFIALTTLAANSTSYTDTTSVAGTSYGYRVIALNSAGDSAASNVATITPTSPTPPPAPTPTPTPPSSGGGGGSFGLWLILLVPLLWCRRSYIRG